MAVEPKTDPNEVSLLEAIQSISTWAMAREDCPREIDEALSLIESICRHEVEVWSDEEAERYGIGG